MDENPYQAPAGDCEDGRRYLAASLSLMGLAGSGFFVYWTCVSVSIALIKNKSPLGFFPFDGILPFFGICPMSAASWLATAWAIWRKHHRILAAAIFFDTSLIAAIFYGF